jgi:hypothetical protein
MLTPLRLLITGIIVFAIGFVFGSANIDPLSAWIGTAGMALVAAGLIWLIVTRFRARSDV